VQPGKAVDDEPSDAGDGSRHLIRLSHQGAGPVGLELIAPDQRSGEPFGTREGELSPRFGGNNDQPVLPLWEATGVVDGFEPGADGRAGYAVQPGTA
jgi:hypothetical protein